jgi:hypothetical protein
MQDTELCNDDYNDHNRDGELAACAQCMWTEGLNVTFDDIRGALDYYSGNIAKAIPNLQKWVHDGKPPGTFCEVSPEEYCNVVKTSGVNRGSWGLALRITPKKLSGCLDVALAIEQILHNVEITSDRGMETVISVLNIKQLCWILQVVGVTMPKGNKPVLVKAVADLFAQQDSDSGSSSSSKSPATAAEETRPRNKVCSLDSATVGGDYAGDEKPTSAAAGDRMPLTRKRRGG